MSGLIALDTGLVLRSMPQLRGPQGVGLEVTTFSPGLGLGINLGPLQRPSYHTLSLDLGCRMGMY